MYHENIKKEVIRLRKQRRSYSQISKELKIAKSTISKWLDKLPWSEKMINELAKESNSRNKEHLIKISQAQQKKRIQYYKEVRAEAKCEFKKLKNDPLFLISLAIYWGEGDKKIENCQIRMSNVDPEMIKIFIIFLVKICKVDDAKIKLWLLLYLDLKEKDCKRYWQEKLNIKDEQFGKTQYIMGRHKIKRLNWGVGNMYTTNRVLKEKLLTWIELLGKMYTR